MCLENCVCVCVLPTQCFFSSLLAYYMELFFNDYEISMLFIRTAERCCRDFQLLCGLHLYIQYYKTRRAQGCFNTTCSQFLSRSIISLILNIRCICFDYWFININTFQILILVQELQQKRMHINHRPKSGFPPHKTKLFKQVNKIYKSNQIYIISTVKQDFSLL